MQLVTAPQKRRKTREVQTARPQQEKAEGPRVGNGNDPAAAITRSQAMSALQEMALYAARRLGNGRTYMQNWVDVSRSQYQASGEGYHRTARACKSRS